MTETPAEPTRGYDLGFDRSYELWSPPVPPPPEPPAVVPSLVPVIWHGMDVNAGHLADGMTVAVELVDGWYGTPVFDGHDADRSLTDGAAWGYKTAESRKIAITGAAAGPRAPLVALRDELARRAALREPAELQITDPWIGRTLTAMVRAGTDSWRHAFFGGRQAFRWEVTLTAADPLLYDSEWQQAVLTTVTAGDAGRAYARRYDQPPAWSGADSGWGYLNPYPDGSAAYLANAGDAAAPVWALYDGDLAQSRLTDGDTSILLNAVGAGVQILVDTGHVTAEAEGGQSRASFIRPGSRPVLIPPNSTARWHLYAEGSGSVTLAWRSAWI